MVLNALRDLGNYGEWDPSLHQIKQISFSAEADGTARMKGGCAIHSQHDIISVECESVPGIMQIINKISTHLQGEALLRKLSVINRYVSQRVKNPKYFRDCGRTLMQRQSHPVWY